MTVAARIPLAMNDLTMLLDRHDIFLVDQFGVLHDGNSAYPGAVEALARLKQAGKSIVLLSNSGKRSGLNEDRLLGLGFRPGSWDIFLSSGEVAWRMFSGLAGQARIAPGTKCLLLARDNDRTAIEGLDIDLVDRGGEADLVLLSGSEGEHVTLDHYRGLLTPAARRDVPCICTNPDKIMLTSAGPRFGAGRIAELYEELGGQVTWIGKPFPEIYRAALSDLGNPEKSRVVGIGDSIEHDIAGAKAAGISAALVRSGILADMPPAGLDDLFRRHDAVPDYVLPGFVWRAG
jgi:HAD superfamily hydrolase (TIGR01459 family)